MTVERLAAGLTEHGFAAAEIPRKRHLTGTVMRAFDTFAGRQPLSAWWVPGRLEVFGKHTDYCGGHSLVGTIPRGFIFLAAPRGDFVIRLLDAVRGEEMNIDTRVLRNARRGREARHDRDATGWRHYAHVVASRLCRNFPGAALGAEIVFASDLPSASGMSSSSALVIGLVNALAEAGSLRTREEWRATIRTDIDAAGYYACFENGAPFGPLAGDAGVGTHGGSEDHVAIVCGAADQVSAWKFVPIQEAGQARLPDDWTFIIASSGVAAQKIGRAREQYNRLAHLARALLDLWNAAEPPQSSLFAALASTPEAEHRLRELVRQSGGPNADLENRLDQFLKEDARVAEALDAFRSGDPTRLGALADASQRDAELRLGNQVPETIALARSARDLGALAASAFGAGFGGSVWALVDRANGEAFATRWLADYRSLFSHRTAATTFVGRPGPALVRLM